jgi:hypothetical protein
MGLAASYAGRLGLTAWRRKSTLLGLAAGLVLLVLCLQYNSASRPDPVGKPEESPLEATSAKHSDKSPLQRTLRNHQEGRNADTASKGNNDSNPRCLDSLIYFCAKDQMTCNFPAAGYPTRITKYP